MKKYKCLNIGNCDNANKDKIFEIAEGEKTECPVCHKDDMLVEVKGPNKKLIGIIVGAMLGIAAIGGAIYAFTRGEDGKGKGKLELTLNHSEKTLKVGDSDTIIATVTPEGTQATFTWKASKDGTIEVQDGIVKAVKGGSGKVRVQAIVGKETLSAICKYSISSDEETVLTLNHTEKELKVGTTDKLVPTLSPASDKVQYTWEANNDCVEVKEGTVKAKKPGKADVKVTATIGDQVLKTVCSYTVEAGEGPEPHNLSYGTWTGSYDSQGLPSGFGDIVFSKNKLVTGNTYAEPGYKIRNGRFDHGRLQSGTLYDADGNKVCFVDANNNL
jgi:hypothetical protein